MLATMRRRAAAILFAAFTVLLLAAGFIWQLLEPDASLDVHLHDTYFVVAYIYIFLLAAILTGLFSIIHFAIAPLARAKTNRILNLLHFFGTAGPILLVLIPVHYDSGEMHPRRYFDYTALDSFSPFIAQNPLVGVAIVVVLAAQILFCLNLLFVVFQALILRKTPIA